MNNRRFPVFLIILAVIVLLFVGRSMGAQDAWTDGFIMGQLTAGADGATVAYAMQNGGRMGGGNPFLGFLAFGAIFFGGIMLLKTLRFRAMGMMADGPNHERWAERMKHWEGRHGHRPPWAFWSEDAEKTTGSETPTPVPTPSPAADVPKPEGDSSEA